MDFLFLGTRKGHLARDRETSADAARFHSHSALLSSTAQRNELLGTL